MRAQEFIGVETLSEDMSRRDFLKGAAGVAASTIIPQVAQAGQYQSFDKITANKEEFNRIWVPRFIELQDRAEATFKRLAQAVKPRNFAAKLNGIQIKITSNENHITASPENRTINIDLTVFWDAPEATLAFVIAHEIGHFILDHQEYDQITPEQSRREELDADRFAVNLCKSLGYNKAQVFKFIHQQEEEYRYYNTLSKSLNNAHPSFDERIQDARRKGFQLSRGGIQQLNTLAQHLA